MSLQLYQSILSWAWSFLSQPITLLGFSVSMAGLVLWDVGAGLLIWLVFRILR